MADQVTTLQPGSSMMDDILASGGGNKGVSGAMKPADIIALEEAGKTVQPPASGADPSKDPAKAGEAGPEFDYEALTKKIEAGEALTADEEAAFRIMAKDLEADAATTAKTYNVAGKVLTRDEVEERVRAEFELGDLAVSEAAMEKMIERVVKSENRTEFSRTLQQKSESLAIQSKAIIEQRIRNEAHEVAIKQMRERIKAERERLEVIAKKAIKKEDIIDPATGAMDPERFILFTAAQQAGEKLDEIKGEEARLAQEQEQAGLKAAVYAFLAEHPQYTTSEDPFVVFEKLSNGGAVSDDDALKVQELDAIVSEARLKGYSPERVFSYRRAAKTLAVQDVAHATRRGAPTGVDLKALNQPKTYLDIIQRHKAKAAKAPGSVPGAGGGDRTDGNVRVATRIVQGDKARMGREKDAFLEGLGYK